MFYSFNISRFIEQMLPPVLRSNGIIAILRVVLAPLYVIVETFRSYRTTTNDRLNINGHVISLEAVLNKTCAVADNAPHISIESVFATSATVLYYESERQQPLYLYKEEEGHDAAIFIKEDEAPPDINFIVHVPQTLCTSLDSAEQDTYGWMYLTRIKNILDRYKPAGRRYEIQLTDT